MNKEYLISLSYLPEVRVDFEHITNEIIVHVNGRIYSCRDDRMDKIGRITEIYVTDDMPLFCDCLCIYVRIHGTTGASDRTMKEITTDDYLSIRARVEHLPFM